MILSTDRLTSILGVLLGVLHQVGMVGTLPVTPQDWLNTAGSVGMALLGYYINKR
jgi:hypothetical protein